MNPRQSKKGTSVFISSLLTGVHIRCLNNFNIAYEVPLSVFSVHMRTNVPMHQSVERIVVTISFA